MKTKEREGADAVQREMELGVLVCCCRRLGEGSHGLPKFGCGQVGRAQGISKMLQRTADGQAQQAACSAVSGCYLDISMTASTAAPLGWLGGFGWEGFRRGSFARLSTRAGRTKAKRLVTVGRRRRGSMGPLSCPFTSFHTRRPLNALHWEQSLLTPRRKASTHRVSLYRCIRGRCSQPAVQLPQLFLQVASV